VRAVGFEDSNERIAPGKKVSEINMNWMGKNRCISTSCRNSLVSILLNLIEFG
jgi:hypothetical protein